MGHRQEDIETAKKVSRRQVSGDEWMIMSHFR